MKLRLARSEDINVSYQCIEDAREYHASLGFEQWHPDYPTRRTIEEDVEKEIGYVFVEDDIILGYCCIIIGDEPAYHNIDGAWKTNREYAVVHRMAFSKNARGGGLSKKALDLIKDFCVKKEITAIRVCVRQVKMLAKGPQKCEHLQHLIKLSGLHWPGPNAHILEH